MFLKKFVLDSERLHSTIEGGGEREGELIRSKYGVTFRHNPRF